MTHTFGMNKRLNQITTTVPSGISGGQFAADISAAQSEAPAPVDEYPTEAGHLYTAAGHVEALVNLFDLKGVPEDFEQRAHQAVRFADGDSQNMHALASSELSAAERIAVMQQLADSQDQWAALADALNEHAETDDPEDVNAIQEAARWAKQAAHHIGQFLDTHSDQHPLPLSPKRDLGSQPVPKSRDDLWKSYPAVKTLQALADRPDSVAAVFGPLREDGAQMLKQLVEGITPTETMRLEVAFEASAGARRVRAYDNGRRRLREMYPEYGWLHDLPDFVAD